MTFPPSLHVCVINLEKDIEKKQKCEIALRDIEFKFISGIDGANLSLSSSSLVTAPIEAIWQSHKSALKDFLLTDKTFCLVLEDDFQIGNYLLLEKRIRQICESQLDLVQIGWLTTGLDIRFQRFYEGFIYFLFRNLANASRFNKNLHSKLSLKMRPKRASSVPKFAIPDSFLPGAHAYVVSRKFAEHILLLNSPTFLATDDFYMAISKMRSFSTCRARKSLVAQNGISGVGTNRFTQILN